MLSKSNPTICEHTALKLHTDIYGVYVQTKCNCLECGTIITVRFPRTILFTDHGLAPLAEIEARCRRLMRKAIQLKVPEHKVIGVLTK